MYYNFCRIHKTLRMTPAMAAGVTDRLWEVADIVALIEAKEAAEAPQKRGPYKKARCRNFKLTHYPPAANLPPCCVSAILTPNVPAQAGQGEGLSWVA